MRKHTVSWHGALRLMLQVAAVPAGEGICEPMRSQPHKSKAEHSAHRITSTQAQQQAKARRRSLVKLAAELCSSELNVTVVSIERRR